MPYSTVEDIKKDFKKIDFDSANAIVTSAMVSEWIEQEDAYIDSWISNRYITPVTGLISVQILKRISIFRVSERVKNKIEVKNGNSQLESEEKHEKNYVRTPNYDLRMIQEGRMTLSDAVLKQAGVGSFNISSGHCHEFDTSKQQW